MFTYIISVAGIAQLLVALFVFSRRWRDLSYFLFFLLGITTLAWAITNYLTIALIDSPNIIVVVRFILFFVVLQNTCFYLFAKTFPGRKWPLSRRATIFYALLTLIAASATLSPFVFTSVEVKDGLAVTKAGPAIMLFMLHAFYSITSAFVALIKKIRLSEGTQKTQLKLLFLACFINWTIVPVTNFALTPLLKTTIFIEYAPVYTLVFALVIAYAMVTQKLFDIRSTVTRTVAYIISLLMVGLTYGAAVFIGSELLPLETWSDGLQRLFYISIAVLSSFLLQPFRHFYDRVTNKFFYRDSYDAQSFIDHLNEDLVSNVNIEELLIKSTELIKNQIKAEWASFFVRETSYFKSRVIGDPQGQLDDETVQVFHDFLPKTHEKVLYVEAQPKNDAEVAVLKILKRNKVELLIRVVSTLDYEVNGVGFLLLGPKRSGNPYSSQDLKVLEIISNELEIAVENSLRFEEIEQFNVTLQKKIDDATRELKASNDKLKALDEAKDEFVSMASHQLRTPLTSIKGYISMVLEGDAGKINDTQKQMLGQAMFSSQRMVYLISDLLNVSRLKTGKFIIEPKPVYLPDLVESEMTQLYDGAANKNIKLSFDKPKKFPTLNLDDMKIRQVVMNFTDNAIYYTPNGGKIVVGLKDKKDSVEFTVKDSGIGVPKAEQHKLFAKFYRADNARKARPDGTGLGLFMAKKVIIAQGGSLIFDSKEGKGSTFGFSFPKDKLLVEPQAH